MALGLVNVENGAWNKVRRNFSRMNSLLIGQSLSSSSSPEFTGLTLSGLTASRLVQSDASKGLASVTGLTSWIAGTANEISVADDGDGSITLGIPDDVTLVNPTVTGILDASAGKVLVEDGATSEPSGENDGYVGVAYVSTEGRIYFVVEGTTYYVTGTAAAAVIVAGNPIGLLLSLTYPATP